MQNTSPSDSMSLGKRAGLRDSPDKMSEVDIEIGLFTDPEGHVIGVVK